MEIKVLSDKMLLGDKDDLIRLYIRAKLMEYGIRPYENDIEIILELYKAGGYTNKKEQEEFISLIINKKFKKTDQSVRNTLSAYTKKKIFVKEKSLHLKVTEEFMPVISCDKLVTQLTISHKN